MFQRPHSSLYNFTWRDEVGHFLNSRSLTGEGVEIGTLEGRYAAQVMSGTSNSPRRGLDTDPTWWAWRGHLTCVDLWDNQPANVYLDCANLRDMTATQARAKAALAPYNVTLLQAHSLEAAKHFEDASLDWVYIDANHSYAAAGADIAAWFPKVKSGGLFSGHDFYTCLKPHHPNPVERNDSDVALAVFEFAEKIQVWPYVTACRSWWFIKAVKI